MSRAGDPFQPPTGPARSIGPIETLDSPERVRLDLEIAGPMSRAFAYSIDYSLILILLTVGLLIVVSSSQQIIDWFSEFTFVQELIERLMGWLSDPKAQPDDRSLVMRGLALTLGVFLILDLTLTIVYFLFFETLFQGRTPGKRLTNLRVVSEFGGVPSWRQSVLRNLLRMADTLPAGYLVGIVAMMSSPRVQRLGDVVAGTLVIRERETLAGDVRADRVVAADVEAGFRFTREELAAVGEVERRLIRRTLRRADTLSARAAQPIVERAVQAISQRIGRVQRIEVGRRREFLLALLQASERML